MSDQHATMLTPTAAPVEIPAEVMDLSGHPRPTDRIFFAPPPDGIGPLYRAESSLRQGKREMPLPLRAAIILAAMIPGGAMFFGGLLALLKSPDDAPIPLLILGAVVAFAGLGIAWYKTRFLVRCYYVGADGAVEFLLQGKVANQPTARVLLFAQAAELVTSSTRHFYNGVYTGTTYSYKWTDPAGRAVLTLSGKHHGKDGLPKPGDPFHFAFATEIAWSTFLLKRADAELAETGCLRFNVGPKKAVLIGPGFIEFHFGGRIDRCEAQDIKSITLSQGTFAIHHRDAKWYSSKGKFSFAYGNMANARLFLLALDRFLPPSTWAQKG